MATFDRLRAQYAANAVSLSAMAVRAARSGRRVGGYTASELRERATAYTRYATLDDTALRAHLNNARQSMAQRLVELRKET